MTLPSTLAPIQSILNLPSSQGTLVGWYYSSASQPSAAPSFIQNKSKIYNNLESPTGYAPPYTTIIASDSISYYPHLCSLFSSHSEIPASP